MAVNHFAEYKYSKDKLRPLQAQRIKTTYIFVG